MNQVINEEYFVYIDESWDHNLKVWLFDNYYNVFVLWAVIIKKSDYHLLDAWIKQIKQLLRWSDDLILHTAEITRPSKSKDPRNLCFNDIDFRNHFYWQINQLISKLPITIVYCAIQKDRMLQQYGYHAEDPYLFSFENILNRILRVIPWGTCDIYPEKRSSVENIKLEAELIKIKTMWSQFYSGSQIQSHINSFILKDKKTNESGLQLADLIVSPIGRHILWKTPRPGNEVDYQTIIKKIPWWWSTIFP